MFKWTNVSTFGDSQLANLPNAFLNLKALQMHFGDLMPHDILLSTMPR